MPLHLVGENIDKARSHYQAETGKLVQLMRGIYVDAGEDIEATVLRHAVRIARYLYPHAYLSAASAVLLGPTRDGRLFLSGRRIQRTRLRSTRPVPHLAKRSLGNSSSGQKKTGQTSGREEAGLIRLPADDRRRLLLRMSQSQARGSRSNVPFTQQPTCETMQMRRVSWPLLSHYVCFLAIKGSSIASDCACSSSRPELMRS
ncbi:hypothetical protein AM571_CH00471 [Rhizobium etli 8C-3]|nr:hypothetical protein AM571_CH00471 [Rhizobium etli 8C-3]